MPSRIRLDPATSPSVDSSHSAIASERRGRIPSECFESLSAAFMELNTRFLLPVRWQFDVQLDDDDTASEPNEFDLQKTSESFRLERAKSFLLDLSKRLNVCSSLVSESYGCVSKESASISILSKRMSESLVNSKSLNNETASVLEANRSLQKSTDELGTELRISQKRILSLESEVFQKNSKINQLSDQLSQMQFEQSNANDKIINLSSEFMKATEEKKLIIQEGAERERLLNMEISSLKSAKNESENKYIHLRTNWENETVSLSNQNDNLNNLVNDLQNDMKVLNKQINDSESHLKVILDERILLEESCQNEKDENIKLLNFMKKTLKELEDTIYEKSSLESLCEEKAERIKDLEIVNTNLKKDLENLSTLHAESVSVMGQMQDLIDRNKIEITKMNGEIYAVRNELRIALWERDRAREEKEDQAKDLALKAKEKAEWQTKEEIDKLKRELAEKNKKNDSLVAEIQAVPEPLLPPLVQKGPFFCFGCKKFVVHEGTHINIIYHPCV